MNVLTTVASFFKEGGPFMFVILGVGVVIVAVIAERFAVIGRAAMTNGRKMTEDLVRLAARGDLAGARNRVRNAGAPPARVAMAILDAGTREESRLQAAGDDAATMALPPLTRRLSFLSTLANAATLLGLLGTIFGLTTAFSAVGAADPAQRSAFLAAGISQALNTTAFGLIVAVPTLLVHGWLVGLVEGIAEQVDEMTIRLSRALSGGEAMPAGSRVVPLPSERAAANPVSRAERGGPSWGEGAR